MWVTGAFALSRRMIDGLFCLAGQITLYFRGSQYLDNHASGGAHATLAWEIQSHDSKTRYIRLEVGGGLVPTFRGGKHAGCFVSGKTTCITLQASMNP